LGWKAHICNECLLDANTVYTYLATQQNDAFQLNLKRIVEFEEQSLFESLRHISSQLIVVLSDGVPPPRQSNCDMHIYVKYIFSTLLYSVLEQYIPLIESL